MLYQQFTYHNHTSRCRHASGSDEDYVLAAIEAGYKVFGFADHIPIDLETVSHNKRMYENQLPEYIESIKELKEKYKDVIDIRLGIEADCYDGCEDIVNKVSKQMEYTILSVHGDSLADPFHFAHPKTDEDIIKYGHIVEELLPKGNWLYLAHPDYYLRKVTDFNDACIETAHRIGQAAVKNNTILEINLSGTYGKRTAFEQGDYYFCPNRLFWQIMSQYPVKVIYGLDAHNPQHVRNTSGYDLARNDLNDLNLDFISEPFQFK